MRKIILFFQIILIALPVVLHAQQKTSVVSSQYKTVTGIVKDVGGILPGATVVEKGMPNNISITNSAGKFTITLKGVSETVIVKFIGYANQTISVAGKSNIEVILQAAQNNIEEVSVIGFTPHKRITATGAVSTINASEIETIPTANVQNALAGRLPGFTAVQASGQPGKDASDFFIRGQSSLHTTNQPLILVDDIEYNYNQLQQINVYEIETISILKDAAETAIYGIRGANGVLIVTTRRGKSGRPKFNLRLEGGLQTPTITPKFLDSYNSALLINQASENDGKPDYFTQDDLNAFKTNSDPYGHPNTDWYNSVFRKFTYQANTNLDISGGTDILKYFIEGGAFTQNGNTKPFDDPQALVNTNYYFKRYNFRTNLDLKANKTLTLRMDVTTRFSDINAPGLSTPISVIYNFKQETPFSAPFINPNGTFAYNGHNTPGFTTGHQPTLNALLANGGYTHDRGTDYNVLIGAVQKLDAITDGLSVTGRVAYASTEDFNKGTNFLQGFNPVGAFPTYYYNPVTKIYAKNPLAPYVYSDDTYYGSTSAYTEDLHIQVFGNYDRTFGPSHFVGLLLFDRENKSDQANSPEHYIGTSIKMGYYYKQKFLFDFNAARNGTDRFAANHQYGYFPAVGIGYVLSEEKYFKNLFPTFSLFKLRFSYGLVGADGVPSENGNRYNFTQVYGGAGGVSFGTSPTGLGGIAEGTLGNSGIVWEKDRKADLGLDVNLLNDKLNATIDWFRDIRYDEFVKPSVSEVLGIAPPYVNSGKVLNSGFDGQITYHSAIGQVQYNVGFVFSYAKNKILYQDETQPAYPWLAQTGTSIGQPFGYSFIDYYSAADIAAATQFIAQNGGNAYKKLDKNGVPVLDSKGNPVLIADPVAVPAGSIRAGGVLSIRPGDLRYRDLNGDGIIDINDKRPVGRPSLPNLTLGLPFGFSYKGFSISVLFQGSFNYSYIITGNGIEPFSSQFQPIHQQAWTPATAATAQFPRLSFNFSGTVDSPGQYPSDYWYLNAYYVRLKSVDLGYQLPAKLLPFHLSNARIYFSAYNLVTWNNFSKYQQDPEVSSNSAGDQYINARVVNLGLQLGF